MVEEEIEIDPKLTNRAFQKGLKAGKLVYIDELLKRCLVDYDLEGYEDELNQAFHALKRNLINANSGIASSNFTLKDWDQFNLNKRVINRIGYVAFQMETSSPVGERRRSSKGFGRVSSTSTNVTHNHEEVYDDDFESVDDDSSINSISKLRQDHIRSDSMDISDTWVMKASNSLSTAGGQGAAIEDLGEVEDETYSDKDYDSGSNSRNNSARASKSFIRRRSLTDISGGREEKKSASPNKASIIKMRPKTSSADNPQQILKEREDEEKEKERRAVTAGNVNVSAVGIRVRTAVKTANWIKHNDWRLGEKIGSGSFGDVYQGMNDKGKLFAVKRLNVKEKSSEVDNLLQEIQLMRNLSHPHIVQYLGASVDPKEPIMNIFQEWVPGGSVAHLLKKFGPFSIGVVRSYTKQILEGLTYLHSNGIIHRDIKGGNILVDDSGKVKLADFGASTTVSFDKTQETTTIKGTPYFMAPEVLSHSRYGRKGDIWAVGCTMIQMLTGEPPWKDMNPKGLVQLHMILDKWDKGPPPYNCEITSDARLFLELCFQKDENKRPSAQDLQACKFVYDEDLEESNTSNNFDNTHDSLEDSGVINGLRRDMDRAVRRSIHNEMDPNDTVAQIDRALARKSQQYGGQFQPSIGIASQAQQNNIPLGKYKNNHNASSNSKWFEDNNNNQDLPGKVIAPISSTPTPPRAQRKPTNDINNTPSSQPLPIVGNHRSSANNPFAKGAISLKNNPVVNQMHPIDQIHSNVVNSKQLEDTPSKLRMNQPSPAHLGESIASEEYGDHTVMLSPKYLASPGSILKDRKLYPFLNSEFNQDDIDTAYNNLKIDNTNNNNNYNNNNDPKGHLTILKRKTQNAGRNIVGSSSTSRLHNRSNQSTNRDSEDNTPLSHDGTDTEDELTVRGSGSNRTSHHVARVRDAIMEAPNVNRTNSTSSKKNITDENQFINVGRNDSSELITMSPSRYEQHIQNDNGLKGIVSRGLIGAVNIIKKSSSTGESPKNDTHISGGRISASVVNNRLRDREVSSLRVANNSEAMRRERERENERRSARVTSTNIGNVGNTTTTTTTTNNNNKQRHTLSKNHLLEKIQSGSLDDEDNHIVNMNNLSNASMLSGEDESDGEVDLWVCKKCKSENSRSEHCIYCATVRGADGRRGVNSIPVYRADIIGNAGSDKNYHGHRP
eukprot:gene4524-6389_t